MLGASGHVAFGQYRATDDGFETRRGQGKARQGKAVTHASTTRNSRMCLWLVRKLTVSGRVLDGGDVALRARSATAYQIPA